jgi:excisionase family DNA binding protein
MEIEIITKKDLKEFKSELLEEIQKIVTTDDSDERKWLRTAEVKEYFNISSSTLDRLRINGDIPYSRLGPTYLYPKKDIENLLEKQKIGTLNPFTD